MKRAAGSGGDALEHEADSIADRLATRTETLDPRRSADVHPASTAHTGRERRSSHPALLSGGEPLSEAERHFFEGHLGHDFSDVRLHTGDEAAATADALEARAFTVGRDIVFGKNERPGGSSSARRLLAHELVHVVQQAGGTPRLQRSIKVEGPRDPADPAAGLSTTARNSMMSAVITQLCPDFSVNAAGDVQGTVCGDPDAVASGGSAAGCCCLCILTAPGSNDWTLRVEQDQFPATAEGIHTVNIPPSNAPTQFGHWTPAGTMVTASTALVLGHELCGHAALMELDVHPLGADRHVSNVHDPTVKIQNVIATELGEPERALATGPHRGESLAVITLDKFKFNRSDVPSTELGKLDSAVNFVKTNDLWVDIIGHSDDVGPSAGKLFVSQKRAEKVKKEMTDRGVLDTITDPHLGPSTRFTRIEGVSDTQPLADPDRAKWRRVDIILTGRPAGTQNPPAGTPSVVTMVPPRNLGALLGRGLFGTACEQLLTTKAWS